MSVFFSGHEEILYLKIRLVSFQRLPSEVDNDCNFCSNENDLCFANKLFSELASLL